MLPHDAAGGGATATKDALLSAEQTAAHRWRWSVERATLQNAAICKPTGINKVEDVSGVLQRQVSHLCCCVVFCCVVLRYVTPFTSGYYVTPNCGHDDNYGVHEVPVKQCPSRTFNDNNSSAVCQPCSVCAAGRNVTSNCTTTSDTGCSRLRWGGTCVRPAGDSEQRADVSS